MQKLIFLFIFLGTSLIVIGNNPDSTAIKPRKLDYNDFIAKYSVHDTSSTIINIFFDKKSNSAIGQMSIFPISVALFSVLPSLSVGLSAISFPFFVNGSVVLIKYRKKKLQKVLIEYKETRKMPKWVRKKVNKSLDFGRFDEE
jgi:hypothetical protein